MNQQDKAFMKSFSIVLGVLVVIAILVFIIASMVSDGAGLEDGSERQAAATAERIKPAGRVVIAGSAEAKAEAEAQQQMQTAATAPVTTTALSGEEVYNSGCNACHTAGVLEAPKLGDNAAWTTRYEKGIDELVHNAINGIKQMPPKGGNTALSDDNVRAAVDYMLSQSGIEAATAEQPAAETTETAATAETTESAATAETKSVEVSAATQTANAANATATNAIEIPADIDLAAGKNVYDMACFVCHNGAVPNSPKLGDKEAWSARVAQGWSVLIDHAINGYKGMPAKGGRADLSDEQVAASVGFMVSNVK